MYLLEHDKREKANKNKDKKVAAVTVWVEVIEECIEISDVFATSSCGFIIFANDSLASSAGGVATFCTLGMFDVAVRLLRYPLE